MTFSDYLQSNPFIALILGTCNIVLAEALKEAQIPVLVMQLFQILAWSVAITVGLITIYGFIKKKK